MLFTVGLVKMITLYKFHREVLQEVNSEVSFIHSMVDKKVNGSEGEYMEDFELMLPDGAYKKIVGSGLNVYLRKSAMKTLNNVYSGVSILNDVFESNEQFDIHKVYSLVNELSKNSLKASKATEFELEKGVYSSFANFVRFHVKMVGIK